MYRETSGGDYKWFEDHPLPRHPSTVLVTAKDRRREFASRDQIPVGWKLSIGGEFVSASAEKGKLAKNEPKKANFKIWS